MDGQITGSTVQIILKCIEIWFNFKFINVIKVLIIPFLLTILNCEHLTVSNQHHSFLALENQKLFHPPLLRSHADLPEETLMVMTSSPSLLLTLQLTVRFTFGTTVIICVALPLT